ncbi:MAG: hypothetical protein AAFR52_13245 [Pseudomonadota bacterium]
MTEFKQAPAPAGGSGDGGDPGPLIEGIEALLGSVSPLEAGIAIIVGFMLIGMVSSIGSRRRRRRRRRNDRDDEGFEDEFDFGSDFDFGGDRRRSGRGSLWGDGDGDGDGGGDGGGD